MEMMEIRKMMEMTNKLVKAHPKMIKEMKTTITPTEMVPTLMKETIMMKIAMEVDLTQGTLEAPSM